MTSIPAQQPQKAVLTTPPHQVATTTHNNRVFIIIPHHLSFAYDPEYPPKDPLLTARHPSLKMVERCLNHQVPQGNPAETDRIMIRLPSTIDNRLV
jgi:hypothetical protein